MNAAKRSEYNKKYRASRIEELKTASRLYYKNNSARLRAYRKQYVKDHAESVRSTEAAFRKEHAQKLSTAKKEYFQRNRTQIYESRAKKRASLDVNSRLMRTLRGRISDVMRGRGKPGSAVKDLGCTIAELKIYLEGKFKDGMTWENHSVDGWHIDHIIPLSFFDLTDREQFLQACHYTNLQPLWAKENISKGNRILHA